jgi:hypothetical protein
MSSLTCPLFRGKPKGKCQNEKGKSNDGPPFAVFFVGSAKRLGRQNQVRACYNTLEMMETLLTAEREVKAMSTAEERQLLVSASRSGSMRILSTNFGRVAMAGPVFAAEGDPSVAEAYVNAVESLVRLGMAKRSAECFYVLTPQGRKEAGRLPAELWQEVHRRFTGRIDLRF